jgi:pantothenate kinase
MVETMGVETMGIVDDLVARVVALSANTDRRVLIGIAGAPGSGKTSLAQVLTNRLGGFPAVAHVPMDGFHLADAELARLGRADRKGAPDTFDVDGYGALLARIAAGEAVWAPGFERMLEQPIAQAIAVPQSTRVVISEGNYLLLPEWRQVRRHFAEVWFSSVDEQLRLARLIARHVQFGKSPAEAARWVQRSDQRNAERVAPTAADADLLVDLSGVDLIG